MSIEAKLNSEILKIIKLFTHSFYCIHPDLNIQCSCVDATSRNGKIDCPKCLGTGHKIYIREIEGAYQNKDVSSNPAGRQAEVLTIGRTYYIPADFKIYNNDIFIDEDKVFFVFLTKMEKSFRNEDVYSNCSVYTKKFNPNILLNNFYKIMGIK